MANFNLFVVIGLVLMSHWQTVEFCSQHFVHRSDWKPPRGETLTLTRQRGKKEWPTRRGLGLGPLIGLEDGDVIRILV